MRRPDSAETQRQHAARQRLLAMILDHARADARVLAVLDYGSTSEGRGDAWSDIDLALAIDPAAWHDFTARWREWLAACGPVMLAFISFVQHPWAVMETEAWPVRVDLHLYGGPPDGDLLAALPEWPNAPKSVDAMLLFDREDRYRAAVTAMIGASLGPEDVAATFTSVSGHFWYYVHRTWSKLQRDSAWDVRWNITVILTGNLCALLRLEAGSTERWQASDAASGIEQAIPAERLAQLNRCVPGIDEASLVTALREMVDLGAEVCEVLAARQGVDWPSGLATTMRELLA